MRPRPSASSRRLVLAARWRPPVPCALAACQPADVRTLSSDADGGRSTAAPPARCRARTFLVDQLQPDRRRAPTPLGHRRRRLPPAVLVGHQHRRPCVPGTDLADEYVVVGAHYDHLGDSCRTVERRRHHLQRRHRQRHRRGRRAVVALGRRARRGPAAPLAWCSPSGTARRTACVGSSALRRRTRSCRSPTPSPTSTSTSRAPTCCPACANTTFAVGVGDRRRRSSSRPSPTRAAQRSPLDVRHPEQRSSAQGSQRPRPRSSPPVSPASSSTDSAGRLLPHGPGRRDGRRLDEARAPAPAADRPRRSAGVHQPGPCVRTRPRPPPRSPTSRRSWRSSNGRGWIGPSTGRPMPPRWPRSSPRCVRSRRPARSCSPDRRSARS